MTPQEAIEFLNETKVGCKFTKDRQLLNVCNMAISALKKEIAKPVTLEGNGYDDKSELIYDIGYCPNCNSKFDLGYDEQTECCPYCGQALDWGDEV